MLVEFSVANFKSIKKKQTLSLMAAPIVSKDESIDENNVIDAPNGMKLLKTLAIYGANASGKSNLVKAFSRMMAFIEKSFQSEKQIDLIECFALDKTSSEKPIHFEIVFLIKKSPYRYGFEITNGKVSAEWLFGPAKKNEVAYFTRSFDQITINKTSFQEGEGLTEGKTRSSTLFLNVTHAFNGSISTEIKDFFNNSFSITTGLDDSKLMRITMEMLRTPHFRQQITQLMKAADFGIMNMDSIELKEEDLPIGISPSVKKRMQVGEKYHLLLSFRDIKGRNSVGAENVFPFNDFESEGTKKFLKLSGAVIQSLANGKCLIIDEFDARLHPSLTRKIVELFNSKENNNNAQLIFVTHDTNLLDPSLMRRDQIYFAEKNKAGETSFYSLINIGGVRNDASFEKDYIKGKYGAIPYLGDFKID